MSKKVKFGFAALAVAVLLVLTTNVIRSCSQKKIVELEQQIEYITEEYVPMEFEISKYSNSEIKLKVVLYDFNGKKVGGQNFKLSGEELNFDFQVIKLNDGGFLFFPCGVYTEQLAIADSISLYNIYNDDGFPEIYNGFVDVEDANGKKLNGASKKSIENELAVYFGLAMDGNMEFDSGAHGVAVHDIKNVSQFQKGFVYKVVCHPATGAVEIIRK